MTSKILIGLTESSLPCIRVNTPVDVSDDLRDQVVKLFFEKLESESSFVGVVRNPSQGCAELIPLNIPSVLEWLERFFVNAKVNDSAIGVKTLSAFKDLREVYFDNVNVSDGSHIPSAVDIILERKAIDKVGSVALGS